MTKAKQRVAKSVLITALICITLLEMFALYNGFNGVLLTTAIGVLALIAGVAIPKEKIIR